MLNSSSITAEKLEKINTVAFNNYFDRWKAIENNIIKGDKIYYYSTPSEYWGALAGQDGLVVIRNCTIICVLILSQS